MGSENISPQSSSLSRSPGTTQVCATGEVGFDLVLKSLAAKGAFLLKMRADGEQFVFANRFGAHRAIGIGSVEGNKGARFI